MQIVAKLTGCLRDVDSCNPKILLKDIIGWNRDHCWVSEESIDRHPRGHQKPIAVIIEAEEQVYIRRGKEFNRTLKILSIKKISNSQYKKHSH